MRQPPLVLNLSDVTVKRSLMEKINQLSGLHEITIRPRKLTRSLNQNSYYWAAFVTPFTEWLRAEWGDRSITAEQAHDELKKAVLGVRTKVNTNTGDVMELIPSSRHLDTLEFSDFLEKAAEFLATTCGIVVLPAELFYDGK